MSISSELCQFTMASIGAQWKFQSADNMQLYLRYLRRGVNAQPLPLIYGSCHVQSRIVAEQRVYHVQPRTGTPRKHVVFIHGGSYVNPLTSTHWLFVHRLVTGMNCSVSVPVYGLVPKADYRDSFELLRELYQQLLEDHSPEDIILMGDSAGGGLALAFSQWLVGTDLPQAGGVVMISPWLDITLSNPDIADVQQYDNILAAPGNREAGRLWAAELDPRDPKVSPLYGQVEGLPPLCLMIGTHDILLPDVRTFRDRANVVGASLDYREYREMFHLWAFAPIPEARPALEQIDGFLAQV